jgi:hypothetical protein
VKRAVLTIEVHRHPAVTAILDVRRKTVGSTLSPLTEQNENRLSIWVVSNAVCPLVAHGCPSRRLQRAAEMGGSPTFADARGNGEVAPKADGARCHDLATCLRPRLPEKANLA